MAIMANPIACSGDAIWVVLRDTDGERHRYVFSDEQDGLIELQDEHGGSVSIPCDVAHAIGQILT